MFVIQELPEWDEMQDTPVYFGGYFKEPKYGTMQPTWCSEIRRAETFADKEDADLLAHDFTEWHRIKYNDMTTAFVVAEVTEFDLM